LRHPQRGRTGGERSKKRVASSLIAPISTLPRWWKESGRRMPCLRRPYCPRSFARGRGMETAACRERTARAARAPHRQASGHLCLKAAVNPPRGARKIPHPDARRRRRHGWCRCRSKAWGGCRFSRPRARRRVCSACSVAFIAASRFACASHTTPFRSQNQGEQFGFEPCPQGAIPFVLRRVCSARFALGQIRYAEKSQVSRIDSLGPQDGEPATTGCPSVAGHQTGLTDGADDA
jgi:hypothetical protein